MNVFYNNKEITNGEFITPKRSKTKPRVEYQSSPESLYTLILHDPDAPAGNHLHWVTINIPGNNIDSGNKLLEYSGPVPPKGSGIHRYIFLLLQQKERNYPRTLERIMSMEDLYDKINIRGLQVVSKAYFTSSNQLTGKKRKRVGTKYFSNKKRRIMRGTKKVKK